jgi:tRNA A37 threonylcarbamoyladenosine dehydratase
MSQQLINHSPDLKRLRDEGFEVEIRSSYILINSVPYLSSNNEIKAGTLVSELTLAGNKTTKPNTHVVFFKGDYPCHKNGAAIEQIRHNSNQQTLTDDLVVNHSFSNKPSKGYMDYYQKMTRYVDIISAPAQSIDSSVTAKTFKVIESEDEESVFNYIDTSSSRAGINVIADKLKISKIGIVGLGGTGSYVLDLVAKTPVPEIHIFDGDKFLQHNAFRSPGAPSLDELKKAQSKVAYFSELYSKMHSKIIPHDCYINPSNIDQLHVVDFVFMCLDKGNIKNIVVDKLEEMGISFIDVGMGVEIVDESLIGILRVTTSTEKKREHVRGKNRISFSDSDDNDDYSQNIQIADLNALNAALAVIKWKKLCGFYQDCEKEHHTTYTLNVNMLTGDDQP